MTLRIALLTYSTKPRGSVVHTLELAEALTKLGHRVRVFALDKDGAGFGRKTCFSTCTVPAAPMPVDDIDALIRQRIDEFVRFFETHLERYDVYHAQDCLSANALAILKQRGHVPHFVRTVHHVENFRSPYLQACQQKSIDQPDRCLCVSELWQQVLARDYRIQAHRVVNGVGQRFSPRRDGSETSLAQAYGLEGGPIYLTIGGIEPRKNSINLLQAFYRLRQQQPQAQLVIAGGATLFDYAPYRRTFMSLVEAHGLAGALVMPGVVPDRDLPSLYRLADVFVFPSVQEGWGLVVLEALASGLPVVTSHLAPFTEFLSPSSARLVNPHDPDAIAAAMAELSHPAAAAPLVAAGQTVVDHYSWERSAVMHLELYRQLPRVM